MPMKYNSENNSITLAGGEPFDLELQLCSQLTKLPEVLTGRAFALILWQVVNRERKSLLKKPGVLGTNEVGQCVRWEMDGTFTDENYDKTGIFWEVSERLDNGRERILTGNFVISPSAPDVDDFDSAPRAKYITRITRFNDVDTIFDAKFATKIVPYVAGTVTPPVVAPSNTAAPTITGTAQVGQVLTVSNGTWTGSPTSYTYVWKAAGTAISGATSASYTAVSGDVGKTLTATVTATNAGGSLSVTTSATSAIVAAPVVTPSNVIRIALAGSSSPEQYATLDAGTSNARNFYTSNGTTFAAATAGRMAMVAGNAIVNATGKDVQWFRGGVGGTTLNGWEVDGSAVRATLVNMIKAAGSVDLVLLQVGFNDIGSGFATTTADRVSKIRSLISKIRTETNLPNLPFALGGTQDKADSPAAVRAVREAEMIVALTDANVRYAFSTYDLDTSDAVHQTPASQSITGQRFAAQVIAFNNGTAQKRGPRVASATAVSDTITDVTLTHTDGTDFTPTSSIPGFTVFNSGGVACAISSAIRQSATVVRLTHASKGNTAGSLIYMPDGGDTDNTSILRDNSSLTLPLEPTSAAIGVPAFAASTVSRTAQMAFRNNSQKTVPSGWNAIINPTPGTAANTGASGIPATAILDTTGAATGWLIEVGGFNTADIQVTTTGNNTGVFPDGAFNNYLYNGWNPETAQFPFETTDVTVRGLDVTKTYKVVAMGSRAATDRLTSYTINQITQTVDAGMNTSRVASFDSITPDASGKIVMTFRRAGSSQYGYLNAMTVSEMSAASTGDGYDIILMRSDSYGVGVSARESQDTVWPNVFQFPSNTGDADYRKIVQKTPLSQPIARDSTSYLSFLEYVGKAYQERTGRKVLLVPFGWNGTAYAKSGHLWQVGDDLHEKSIAQANAAIAAAKAISADSKIVAIVEALGANDSNSSDKASFKAAKQAALTDVRARVTGAASVPYINVGILGSLAALTTNARDIEAAIQEIAAENANARFVPVDAAYNSGDNLHMTNAGCRAVGALIDQNLADVTAPTIATPSTASVVDGSQFALVLTTGEYATWSIVGGADAAKFELNRAYGTGGANNINSISSTMSLRFAGNVSKSYASPDDANGDRIYNVTVRARDASGNTTDKAIAVSLVALSNQDATVNGGAPAITALSGGTITGNNVSGSYTINRQLGKGTNLIYVKASGTTTALNSITVAGATATKVSSVASGDVSSVFAITMPASGTYDIVLAFNGTLQSCDVVIACLNNTKLTPTSVSSTPNGYKTAVPSSTDGPVTGATGGIGVVIGQASAVVSGSSVTVLSALTSQHFVGKMTAQGAASVSHNVGYACYHALWFDPA